MTEARTPQTSTSDDPVLHYANEVLAGRVVAGPLVRLACKRHLDDLENGPKRGLRWDLDAALDHINFFRDVLKLGQGEHGGKPFELTPWQKFVQGSLFGWKAADGFRRFRTAYIEIGKGNGKSPMAGGTGLYMMVADGEVGAHCFAAAVTRDQANILFQDAVQMVDASPALRRRIQKSGKRHVFNLAYPATGSFFRAVSSEGRGLDGKRVHFGALDEIHEHPTPIVVQKIDAGKKGRRQPLIYEITNSGFNRESICWDHHEYSRQILEGNQHNDTWFAFVCGLDPGDDWHDERVWLKANPNLGISITHEYLRQQVQKADAMPSEAALVERLNFCIWNEASQRWIEMAAWDGCSEVLEPERDDPCYGGIDLALTRDLSAFDLIFPPTPARSKWIVKSWFWCSDNDIAERSRRDNVDYEKWRRMGFITATPGNVTDHDYIETAIKKLRTEYNIRQIGFDRALASQIITHLQDEGCEMIQIPQGAQTLNSPVRTIEKLILGKQIAHGGHPVLRWNAGNAVLLPDSNGNVKFDKAGAAKMRIDGLSAAANAMWCALADQSTAAPGMMIV